MRIIVDSGFWFGFIDQTDGCHGEALDIYEKIMEMNPVFLIPYPSLYETLNTKMLKMRNRGNPRAHKFFTALKTDPRHFVRILDDNYRERAFENTVAANPRGLSLVDNIIREIMCDTNQHIDALITFNTSDFIDICTDRGIIVLDGK
jgi:predicted nucleic acid-binding protein